MSNRNICLEGVSPCTHEEADSRIFVHAKHAVIFGCKSIVINANDTDVLVIALLVWPSLNELDLQRLWVLRLFPVPKVLEITMATST